MPLNSFSNEIQTLWYRSPEVLLGSKNYGVTLDMWSVGCIFAEFLQGKAFIPGDSQIDQIFKIFKIFGTPNETIWPGVNTLPHMKATFPQF
jgi:serine/threonine protein kinase